jgi:hypothetical protein
MVSVIIGFTGQGKSTLAKRVADGSTTRVIFDPRGQFNTTSDVLPDADGLYALLDDRFEIIIQPGRGREVSQVFDDVCRELANWIEDNPGESVVLLADEGRLIGLDSRNVSLNFDWIVRSAREGSTISVVITCHRPVDVSTNIRAISNRLVFFRVMLPGDLDSIEEQCGPQVTEEVKKLLDKQFVVWNNSRQCWKKETNPATWYVKISEVPTVGYVG